jgi:hypothetical protein
MSLSISTQHSDDQILSALESISQKMVVSAHSEANGYLFKGHDNKWHTAKFDFVHDIANSYDKKGNYR